MLLPWGLFLFLHEHMDMGEGRLDAAVFKNLLHILIHLDKFYV